MPKFKVSFPECGENSYFVEAENDKGAFETARREVQPHVRRHDVDYSWSGCTVEELIEDENACTEYDRDEDIYEMELPPWGRLILQTSHGQIIIDNRKEDVNCYVIDEKRGRVDNQLLPLKTDATDAHLDVLYPPKEQA